jgi:hypothetical protein
MTRLLSYLRGLTNYQCPCHRNKNKILAALLRWFVSGAVMLSAFWETSCAIRDASTSHASQQFCASPAWSHPAPEIVQPTQPDTPSGSMANASAKCNVMSPGSDTQRSPRWRPEATCFPYPLRWAPPHVQERDLRWFRIRELRQLARVVARASGI